VDLTFRLEHEQFRGELGAWLDEHHPGPLGGGELDLALVLGEVGHAALPDAILESCLLAPYLIATSASKDIRDRWLPLMAAGSARVTASLSGSDVAADLHVSDAVLLRRDGELLLLATADLVAEPLSSMDPSRRLFRARPLPGAGVPLARPGLDGAAARTRAGSAAMLNGAAIRQLPAAARAQ
jgi:hypothetical protein